MGCYGLLSDVLWMLCLAHHGTLKTHMQLLPFGIIGSTMRMNIELYFRLLRVDVSLCQHGWCFQASTIM